MIVKQEIITGRRDISSACGSNCKRRGYAGMKITS
jgi:hypothetical protein